MENPKYLKISLYPFQSNSRDARELETAEEAGFKDIEILTFSGEKGQSMAEKANWKHTFINRRPLGNSSLGRVLGKMITSILFVLKARAIHAQVLSGHDLLGLLIAYLASLGRRKKTALIYDAHEYELGRATGKPRSSSKKRWIARLEKFLIKRSTLTISVNQSIAEEMEKDYQMTFPHVIARNIPVRRTIDKNLRDRVRKSVREKLKLKEGAPLLLYHGNLTQGRGIEESICLLSKAKNAGLLILGKGSESYKEKLKAFSKEKGVEDRVLFHPAVPGEILLSYVAACDIAMVLIQQKPKSYYFALPNKLFESIHAGLPVIASDSPEISRIVDGYGLGLTVDPEDSQAHKKALDLLWQQDYYKKAKNHLKKAQEELTWENEKEKLYQALKNINNKFTA